jgi:alpha-methylacyl-CoA racemase
MLDTGAHFYDTYETSDGKYLAVGAIEPQFYAELRRLAGLEDDPDLDSQMAFYAWPDMTKKLAAIFRTRSRAAWMAVFEGSDACVAPVLSMAEAPSHPHNEARGTFIEMDGVVHPAPAPRFSVSAAEAPRMAGDDTDGVLAGLGYAAERILALRDGGIVGSP